MAKTRSKGIVKLQVMVERLQNGLLSGIRLFSNTEIKEGHFAVMAEDDDELKRFVVPLRFLAHPSFLRLLEEAAEEYGFDRDGALMVPCRPAELKRILAREEERVTGGGGDR